MSKGRGKGRPKDDKKTDFETLHVDEDQATSEMLTQEDSRNESQILTAIQSLRNDFSTQLHEVISSNREIKEVIVTFSERLTEAETRIGTAEDQITSLTTLADTTQKQVQKFTSQIEELENRQRRSNLRLVGLPEGSENGDVRAFLMAWLPKTLDMEAGQPLTIEQAYRLGKPQTQEQLRSDVPRPRILMVKFLTYRDRDRVMKAARLKGDIMVDRSRVMFFPDLSTEVLRQRKLFDGVKQSLRQMRKEYGFMFPAKLRILHNKTWHYFTSALQAEEFIRKMKKANNNHDAPQGSSAEELQSENSV